MQKFKRMNYIVWGAKQAHVLTHHKNLLFVFAPFALPSNSPRHVLSKVHRRAIHLSRFEFFINHFDGTNNGFADIVTRWSKDYQIKQAHGKVIAALYHDITPASTKITTISLAEIKEKQSKFQPPDQALESEDGIYRRDSRI